MNEKVVVVLLLITIVLSITSIAILFTAPSVGVFNFADAGEVVQPVASGSVGFTIDSSPGGTG